MDKRIIMLAALAFAAVACGDDEDPAPPLNFPDTGVQSPIDAGIDSSTPNQSDASTDGSTPVVVGAPNCFRGTAKTNNELLNACAEGWVVFDNNTRLPGYNGTLPPLQ